MNQIVQKMLYQKYSFLTNSDWTADFCFQCEENIDCFIGKSGFLVYVDPSRVVEKLKIASASEVFYFCNGIRMIYRTKEDGDGKSINGEKSFGADYENISFIIKSMGSFESKVKNYNVQRLQELLIHEKELIDAEKK